MSESKAELRAILLAARGVRPAAELAAARAAVARHVLGRVAENGWRRVAAYEPMRTEPGSAQLLAGLHEHGVEVLVPVTMPDRDLDWRRWAPSMTGGADVLGAAAIASVDLVLAPALAVASDGTRLGRGGGSYDRALARVPTGVTVAALLFDGELIEALRADPWDLPVTAVITPAGWLDLGARNTGMQQPG